MYRDLDGEIMVEMSRLGRRKFESRRDPESGQLVLDEEMGEGGWSFVCEVPLNCFSQDNCRKAEYNEALRLMQRIDAASSGNIPMELILLEVARRSFLAGVACSRR